MNEDRDPRGRRTILVALVGLAVSGCAPHRGLGRRGDTMRPPSFANPTVGTDRRAVPRGQTIPPSGLGVDLVRLPGEGTTPTGPAARASPPPVPIEVEVRRVGLTSAH
jgi:hypothetical protein